MGGQEYIPVPTEDGQDFVVAGEGEYEIEMLVNVSEWAVEGFFRVKLIRE